MPLAWNIEKIPNYESVCWVEDPDASEGRRINPATESLIWYTVACCMTGITAENAEEMWARIYFYDRVAGPIFTIDGEAAMTKEIVLAHVGLFTNVTTVDRNEWLRHQCENTFRDSRAVLPDRPIDELRSTVPRSLEPMVDVLDALVSRGSLSDDDIEGLSEQDVDDLYWKFLAPVVTKVQSRVPAGRHREEDL